MMYNVLYGDPSVLFKQWTQIIDTHRTSQELCTQNTLCRILYGGSLNIYCVIKKSKAQQILRKFSGIYSMPS